MRPPTNGSQALGWLTLWSASDRVAVMRRFPGRARWLASLRREASAVLVAALLSLFLSQPFHAPPPASDGGPAFVAAPADATGGPSHSAAHDADRCAQC